MKFNFQYTTMSLIILSHSLYLQVMTLFLNCSFRFKMNTKFFLIATVFILSIIVGEIDGGCGVHNLTRKSSFKWFILSKIYPKLKENSSDKYLTNHFMIFYKNFGTRSWRLRFCDFGRCMLNPNVWSIVRYLKISFKIIFNCYESTYLLLLFLDMKKHDSVVYITSPTIITDGFLFFI